MIIGHPMKTDGTASADIIIIGITHADCVALLQGKAVSQSQIPESSAIRSVLVIAGATLEEAAAKLRAGFAEAGKDVEEFRYDAKGQRV